MGDSLRTLGSEKNFRWEISPPDSPWRQGKAERRIAIVKKLLKLSVGDSRLTPVELQTILYEISNICNERPIGLSKPRADGSYVVVTPNQLLLGRSNSILPDDAQLASDMPVICLPCLHMLVTVSSTTLPLLSGRGGVVMFRLVLWCVRNGTQSLGTFARETLS